VKYIIEESPLIQTYCETHRIIEHNFLLNKLTTSHADPKMMQTFAQIQIHLDKTMPHKIQIGRNSKHIIQDMQAKGLLQLLTGNAKQGNESLSTIEETAGDDKGVSEEPEILRADNVMGELVD
jgi:hypothetical protein